MDRARVKYEKDNFVLAQLCAMFANIHRDTKKHPEPFGPWDFIPGMSKPQELESQAQTPEQMFAIVQVLNAAFGGDVTD